MRLASHVVGLVDPAANLVVEFALVLEIELIDPVGPSEVLHLRGSRWIEATPALSDPLRLLFQVALDLRGQLVAGRHTFLAGERFQSSQVLA